jgi:hypothetical protein
MEIRLSGQLRARRAVGGFVDAGRVVNGGGLQNHGPLIRPASSGCRQPVAKLGPVRGEQGTGLA